MAGEEIDVVAASAAIPGPPPGCGAGLHQLDQGGDDLLFCCGGASKLLRERDWDAAMKGKARDARVTHPQGDQSPMALLVVHGAPSAEEGAIVGKRVKASMAIAIELSDHQAQALNEAAARLQVSESELAAAVVRDLLANQSADFDAAAQRALEKNQELYRRLA
jgi:hypothetical protein